MRIDAKMQALLLFQLAFHMTGHVICLITLYAIYFKPP